MAVHKKKSQLSGVHFQFWLGVVQMGGWGRHPATPQHTQQTDVNKHQQVVPFPVVSAVSTAVDHCSSLAAFRALIAVVSIEDATLLIEFM